jgi:hypothetical protein
VADEPTPGELYRTFLAHQQQTAEEHKQLREQASRIALEAVHQNVYQSDLRARDREITALDRRVEAVEKRPGLTAGRIAVIATAVIALAALLVQAYGTIKGAK